MQVLRLGLGVSVLALLASSAIAVEPAPLATAPAGNDAPMAQPSTPAQTATPAASPAPAVSTDATAAQIKGWISADSHDLIPPDPSDYAPQPRAIHGEVGAGIGSGGYRNVYGVADIPVGQNSDLIVAASNSSGGVGRRGYGGYGGTQNSLAIGFFSNGAANSAPTCNGSRFAQPMGLAGQIQPNCAPLSGPGAP